MPELLTDYLERQIRGRAATATPSATGPATTPRAAPTSRVNLADFIDDSLESPSRTPVASPSRTMANPMATQKIALPAVASNPFTTPRRVASFAGMIPGVAPIAAPVTGGLKLASGAFDIANATGPAQTARGALDVVGGTGLVLPNFLPRDATVAGLPVRSFAGGLSTAAAAGGGALQLAEGQTVPGVMSLLGAAGQGLQTFAPVGATLADVGIGVAPSAATKLILSQGAPELMFSVPYQELLGSIPLAEIGSYAGLAATLGLAGYDVAEGREQRGTSTLGGAGIGFMLGGPVGAGIGAALGGLSADLFPQHSPFYAKQRAQSEIQQQRGAAGIAAIRGNLPKAQTLDDLAAVLNTTWAPNGNVRIGSGGVGGYSDEQRNFTGAALRDPSVLRGLEIQAGETGKPRLSPELTAEFLERVAALGGPRIGSYDDNIARLYTQLFRSEGQRIDVPEGTPPKEIKRAIDAGAEATKAIMDAGAQHQEGAVGGPTLQQTWDEAAAASLKAQREAREREAARQAEPGAVTVGGVTLNPNHRYEYYEIVEGVGAGYEPFPHLDAVREGMRQGRQVYDRTAGEWIS